MNVQYRRSIASILVVVAMSVCGRAMTTTTIVPSYNFVGGQHARRPWSKSETRLRETKEAGMQHVSPHPQVLSQFLYYASSLRLHLNIIIVADVVTCETAMIMFSVVSGPSRRGSRV